MSFCIEKRKQILKEMDEFTICLMTSGPHVLDSADDYYPYSVNRNFYYLTQIDEADVILLLVKGYKEKEILYIKKPDPVMEKWVGKTISDTEAKEKSGIEDIRYLDHLEKDLKQFIQEEAIEAVYIDDENDEIIHFGLDLIQKYKCLKKLEVLNIYPLVAELRACKEEEEIVEIRKAITVTNKGIMNMLDHMKPGMKECEIEAYYNFVLNSEQMPVSFKTIAASGANGTILHYSANKDITKENDLILFDLGVASKRWCSDISRTFPISGKFTERQRLIYDIVLRTQKKVEEAAKPGVTIGQLQNLVIDSYKEELLKIGKIEKGTLTEVRQYYWHGISHSIGLDVHDVGIGRDDPLKPGMIISNEPGLYLEDEGIGIRIEDDLLITEEGCENLSLEIIKDPDEIEAYMAARK